MVVLVFSFSHADTSASKINIYVESTTDLSDKDTSRVKKEIEIALDNIPALLGIEFNEDIDVRLKEHGICKAKISESYMFQCNIKRVKSRKAAIVHEMVHLITTGHHNKFLSEGLAVHFHEKFGEDFQFPKTKGLGNLNDHIRKLKDSLQPLSKLMNNNDVFRFKSKEENFKRMVAYTQAGSFISFLVEKYGYDKLKELNEQFIKPINTTLKYASVKNNIRQQYYSDVYSKNVEELEKEWLNAIFKDKWNVITSTKEYKGKLEPKDNKCFKSGASIYLYGNAKNGLRGNITYNKNGKKKMKNVFGTVKGNDIILKTKNFDITGTLKDNIIIGQYTRNDNKKKCLGILELKQIN